MTAQAFSTAPSEDRMNAIRNRLEKDLKATMARLGPLGRAVARLPGAAEDNTPFADEVDTIQADASREIGLASRERLVERVHRLSAALERLKAGEYGLCVECAEPIAAARLRAAPEVPTCVRCQDQIERYGPRAERERAYSSLATSA
jgi:DnaK suppressor protein